MHYLGVLAVTLAFELAVVVGYALLRRRSDWLWLMGVALAANLATHGLFYLAFPRLPGSFALKLTALELLIALAEGLLYATLGRMAVLDAALVSFSANLCSLVGGIWLLRP